MCFEIMSNALLRVVWPPRPAGPGLGVREIVRASGNLKRGRIPLVIAQKLHGTVDRYPTPPIEGPLAGRAALFRKR